MTVYAERTRRPPKTLTVEEQKKLLRITGESSDTYRDHIIFSVALGTALRETEILSLDCGDVFDSREKARRRVALRVFKRGSKNTVAVPQEVYLPDSLRYKLDKFRRWKQARGESVADDAPLFVAKIGKYRIGARRLRKIFRAWQEKAEFAQPFRFHALRHTCLTNLYRATRDLRLVQRVARHASITTTTIYACPSDEDISNSVRDLDC